MANKVVCATLAIPIPVSRNAVDSLLVMDESGMEKQRRLATLLMLPSPPTRQSLVKDLVRSTSHYCLSLCMNSGGDVWNSK